ncbi:MAG: hypothetical protein PHW04_08090 [Candidatus Wallbacteria bacterium]|nr:hypothetical protein [Candidatus Wallbacteria bacterium]
MTMLWFLLIYPAALFLTVFLIARRQKQSFRELNSLPIGEQTPGKSLSLKEEQANLMILDFYSRLPDNWNRKYLRKKICTASLSTFRELKTNLKYQYLQQIEPEKIHENTDIIEHCLKSRDFSLQYLALKLLQKECLPLDLSHVECFLCCNQPVLQREALKALSKNL